jgi:hypothetical protein
VAIFGVLFHSGATETDGLDRIMTAAAITGLIGTALAAGYLRPAGALTRRLPGI